MINRQSAAILIACQILCHGILIVTAVEFKIDPIVLSKRETDAINRITPSEWLSFTIKGIESNKQEQNLEKNLVAANAVVKNGSISHVQLLDTLPSTEVQVDIDLADEVLKASSYVYNAKCASQGISGEHCAVMLSDIELPKTSELAEKCQRVVDNRKDGHYPLRRLLPRHYKDGFYMMFSNKPEPLTISQAIGGSVSKEKTAFLDRLHRNLAVVQWSQFVAHDLNKPVVTTMRNGSPIDCCDKENYDFAPRHQHPACERLIAKSLGNFGGRDTCLSYVRSALTVGKKCTFAPPEQLNQETAKLDLSQLYGFTGKFRDRMRLHRMGLLKASNVGSSQDSLLPMTENDTHSFCALNLQDGSNSACFMAGDSRVNSNPFTIILYTIMMRNHNLIAKHLSLKHQDWSDDQIFQRAKSINTEIYKRIVFNEWLPIILGTSIAKNVNTVGGNKAGDESQYQTSNEYAVAASRFFLSMMPNELYNYSDFSSKDNSIFVLKEEIYAPSIEYSSKKLDQILHSLLMQEAMKLDASYVESLTADLRNNKRPTHRDLLAFDIQRGRDHGLQPYYKYLEACNSIKIREWNNLQRFMTNEDITRLQRIYSSWRDIDLIVGGILETAVGDATVGPTFQCIIVEQFSKLRQWNQMEVEESDLDFLKWKTATAADLLCLNSNLQQLPSNIFEVSSKTNPMVVNCSERRNKFL